MQSRLKLLIFMLLPILIVGAVVLIVYNPVYFGRGESLGSQTVDLEEMNRRITALQKVYGNPDVFTAENGFIYMRRNAERLKAFTITDHVVGEISAKHVDGQPWQFQMANKLPEGTKLYRVTNEPTLLAVKTGSVAVIYKAVQFDEGEPVV